MTVPARAVLAELFEITASETPYGGRAVTYDTVGFAWLKPGTVRRRERGEAGVSAVLETLTAETRSDARLTVGRVLRFSGADWRIVSGETIGGRAMLTLERMR